MNIDETKQIKGSGTAATVKIGCRAFIATNAGTAKIYIKPCETEEEKASTADFPIAPNETVSIPMCCEYLSVIGEGGDLRLLIGSVWR